MKRKRHLFSIKSLLMLSFSLLIFFSACENEEDPGPEPDPCENTNYTYTADIKIIFDRKCASSSCHAGNNDLPDYSTYEGVFNDRFRLKSGISQGISQLINGRAELSEGEEEKILCWIETGAKE